MKNSDLLSRFAVVGVGLAMVLGVESASSAEFGDVDEPIVLAMNEWTGQHITTKVAGKILERAGYKVEYVTAGYFPQFIALGDGAISATLEIWSNNIGENFFKAEETGNVVNIGDLGLETREGWVYPKSAEAQCPGLPDWQALSDCAETFATPETFPDGRLLGMPADWGDASSPIIESLDIPYQRIPAGSEGAMIAELQSASERGSPLLVYFWSPHWLFAEMDVGWVDLPTYESACMDDASWGPNPNEVNDCGIEAAIPFKVAWTGMAEKWPAAFEILKVYQMNVEDQIQMMAAVDHRGEALDDVTEAWVVDNEATWRPWVDEALQN